MTNNEARTPRSSPPGILRGRGPRRRARLLAATRAAMRGLGGVVEVMEPRRMLAAGHPDPTFGEGGTGSSPFPGIEIWATQGLDNRNGKTVVAGEAAEEFEPPHSNWFDTRLGLVRFTESGEPDPTFGGDGRILSDLLGGNGRQFPGADRATVTDVLIQPDDKV